MNEFERFFDGLSNEFSENNACHVIENPEYEIEWNDGYGVYTLWDKEITFDNLIYVGLTGKLKRDYDGKVKRNTGSFKKRTYRWTPYRFCESRQDPEDYRFTFRYGPKYSNTNQQGRHKYDIDAYEHTIPYKDLIIVTLDVKNSVVYTPALLESLILTRYFFESGDLPPANNEL